MTVCARGGGGAGAEARAGGWLISRSVGERSVANSLARIADRPACWHCLKSATLRGIPHSQVRCYYRSFDQDGNEVVQDWPLVQQRGKCSTTWTGPAYEPPPPSPAPELMRDDIKFKAEEEVERTSKGEGGGMGWKQSMLGEDVDEGDGERCDSHDSPISTSYSRLSTPSTAPTSPQTSPLLDKNTFLFDNWPTPQPTVPRPLANPLIWPSPLVSVAVAAPAPAPAPVPAPAPSLTPLPPVPSYYATPQLDFAAFQNSSLFGSPYTAPGPLASTLPTGVYHPSPTATLPSPAATPPVQSAALPYPFRVSFSPHGHTTTLCPAPPASAVRRCKPQERRVGQGAGFWSGGPLTRSELMDWDGLGKLRSE